MKLNTLEAGLTISAKNFTISCKPVMQHIQAIDNLRNLDNLEEEEQENIKNALKWMTDSREEIIEDMEYLLSKADPSHDFLHLSFY